jgi:hypothetical protein
MYDHLLYCYNRKDTARLLIKMWTYICTSRLLKMFNCSQTLLIKMWTYGCTSRLLKMFNCSQTLLIKMWTYGCTSRLLKMFNCSQTQYQRHHMYLPVAADGNSEFACVCFQSLHKGSKVQSLSSVKQEHIFLSKWNVTVFSLVLEATSEFSGRLYDRKG